METTVAETLRGQLADRRHRLQEAIAKTGQVEDLVRLLQEVDSALNRMDVGTFGGCLVCGDKVEEKDLLLNPLLQYCLCRLDTKQMDSLQHDLDLARHIQAGLLPRQDLRAHGWMAHYRYEPAGPVSGDYCDFADARGDNAEACELFFTMADVSGKGVAAALLMAHLNASFRSFIQVGLPLQEIVARQNRLFLETNLPSHYATLVCGRASASGRLEICNAGHCPPLLIRRSGVVPVGETGFPIGMVGDRSYAVVSEQLEPGDTLLLYTDGLTEARQNDEEFGQARLMDLVRRKRDLEPRALADAVLAEMRQFMGAARPHDDLSLLVMRRES